MRESGILVPYSSEVQNAPESWRHHWLCREWCTQSCPIQEEFWVGFTHFLGAILNGKVYSMFFQVWECSKTAAGTSEIMGLFSDLVRQTRLQLFKYCDLHSQGSQQHQLLLDFVSSCILSTSLWFQRCVSDTFLNKKNPRKRTMTNSTAFEHLFCAKLKCVKVETYPNQINSSNLNAEALFPPSGVLSGDENVHIPGISDIQQNEFGGVLHQLSFLKWKHYPSLFQYLRLRFPLADTNHCIFHTRSWWLLSRSLQGYGLIAIAQLFLWTPSLLLQGLISLRHRNKSSQMDMFSPSRQYSPSISLSLKKDHAR